MSASIGFRIPSRSRTAGTSGRTGGMNDQCRCHVAPSLIHRLSFSISEALSDFPDFAGGIRSPASFAVIRR